MQDVLGVDPTTGCRIMLTEPPMNPKSNRQRMLEVGASSGSLRSCSSAELCA